MKRILLLVAAAALFAACGNNQPSELYVPKGTVEFAGNAFSSFSLGADVKLYTVPSPSNSSEWTVQAVVPVRKETDAQLEDLQISLVPLDDHNIRVRDGFVLVGEDLQSLIPVYNAGNGVERTVVFSAEDGKKYFSKKEADAIIARTKGVRIDFNAVEKVKEEARPTKKAAVVPQTPRTVEDLCRKYGIYGMMSKYETLIKNKDKDAAKKVEDQMWAIEKKVKADESLPKDLRKSFVSYVEKREDEIEKKYK
jgi:hypothetical protein